MKKAITMAAFALIACGSLAWGQCGPGGCKFPPGLGGGVVGFPERVEWRALNAEQDECLVNGRRIGGYDHPTQSFTEWLGNDWGRVGLQSPYPPPRRQGASLPTGVDVSKLSQGKSLYTRKGVEITRGEAEDVIGGGLDPSNLQDDSNSARLTIIASDATARKDARERIEASGEYKAMKPKLLLWDSPRDHWSVDNGFKTDTDGIILQAADGTVLHRQESLDVPKAIEALRRRMPNYDPKRDPDATSGIWERVKGWFKKDVTQPLMLTGGMLLGLIFLGSFRADKEG